jgi:hypothetical protein
MQTLQYKRQYKPNEETPQKTRQDKARPNEDKTRANQDKTRQDRKDERKKYLPNKGSNVARHV